MHHIAQGSKASKVRSLGPGSMDAGQIEPACQY